MKLAKNSARLGMMVLAAIAAPAAMAQSSWYGGFGVGATRATIDDERIISGLAAGRLATTSIAHDERDTGYKIYFGRQFNRYLALEAGVFDLGEFGFTASTVPAGTLDGRIKLRGLNLDLVGTWPITERFSAFGRVGVNHAEAKDTFTSTGLVRVLNPNPSKRDTNYKVGIGLQYALTEALTLRAEVERYRIDDAVGNKGDIDMASVGLTYHFGRTTRAAPMQRMTASEPAAPAPVAAAPTPAYQPPAASPPPPVASPRMPTTVVFSADALFDFDRAIIKPAGKQALDKFVADMRGMRVDSLVITGHTDRIGSVAYNQKLSAQRADAVRAYLVNAGVAPGMITARGVGKSNPVTPAGQCKGTAASKAVVACLQPDRRVEVEVKGTR